MLKETFFLDNIDASSVGLRLQSPVEFSEPVPVVESDEIDGRNGNLIYETGVYENRTATARCFALQKCVGNALTAINRFLLSKHGYRRLETSDRPNHFWLARVSNGARIEQRMRTLAPFEIEFDCKPQCFVKDGENAVLFTSNGVINNQYFHSAKPLIKLYGSGDGVLYIGEYRVDVLDSGGMSSGKPLFLDSDTMNAYNVDGNQNKSIKCIDFPVLVDGENTIKFSGGIEAVSIIPRWWEL
jgi:phage-related protein